MSYGTHYPKEVIEFIRAHAQEYTRQDMIDALIKEFGEEYASLTPNRLSHICSGRNIQLGVNMEQHRSGIRYPKEVIDFIKDHGSEYTRAEMVDVIIREFGEGYAISPKNMSSIYQYYHIKSRPPSIFTPEIIAFIHDNYTGVNAAELTALINAQFGTDYTIQQVRHYRNHNHLDSGLGFGGAAQKGRSKKSNVFSAEVRAFIQDNHIGMLPSKMAILVNERFGTSYTPRQITSYYRNHGIKTGIPRECWYENMSSEYQAASRETARRVLKQYNDQATQKSNEERPIGTVLRRRKYCYIKTATDPIVWEPAHRVEWEKHYGPIPPGHKIYFIDGNTHNWHIDNLVCLSGAERAESTIHGHHGYDKESYETVKLLAQLRKARNELKKKHRRKE